jgi:hypothetical protein
MSFYSYEIQSKHLKKRSLLERLVKKIEMALNLDIVKLNLTMKYIDVLRGYAFIDDLKETFGENHPECKTLNISDIISILYEDFIKQIKNGNQNHKVVAEFLLDGKLRYIDSMKKNVPYERRFKQITPNTFIYEDVELEDDDIDDDVDEENLEETVYVEIFIKEKFVNRGKILLYDLEPYLKGEKITIEDVISIRYLNFIDQLRVEGNNRKVMKAILISLGKTLE